MPFRRTVALVLFAAFLAAPVLSEGTKAPAPLEPVSEVASLDEARALEAGVTRVRLASTCGDDVLAELPRLKGLTTLLAPESAVTDEGLKTAATLTALREVDLSRCAGVTGAGVKHLGSLKKLEVLRLAGLTLDDAALAPLARLTRLKVVDLGGCKGLGDTALEPLRELEKLEELTLSDVPFTLKGMQSLVRMRTVRILRAARTAIPDEAMVHIVGLKSLEQLDVSGNPDFGWIGLLHLSGLRKLKSLDASGLPNVTDEALQRAAKMETLESLAFANCARITDAGVSALAATPRLASLDVSRTRVTGKGLLALAASKSLRTLRVLNCPGVTSDDLAAARAAMPAVTIHAE